MAGKGRRKQRAAGPPPESILQELEREALAGDLPAVVCVVRGLRAYRQLVMDLLTARAPADGWAARAKAIEDAETE